MPIPTYDLLVDKVLLHSHKSGDITDLATILDSRYLLLNQTTPQTTTGTFTFPSVIATNYLKTPKIYPSADSTTAIQILKADGTTSVLNVDTTNQRVGIGTTSPSALIHGIKTTEQLRLGYDASNYYSTTVSSAGHVTFDTTGTGFRFSDNVGVGVNASANYGLHLSGTSATMPEAGVRVSGTDIRYGLSGVITYTDPANARVFNGDGTLLLRSDGTYYARGGIFGIALRSYDGEITFNAATGVNVGTDTITRASGTVPDTDTPIIFSCLTAETMPTGLSTNTTYYVIKVSTTQFQLALSPGGGAVDITATGTGTIYGWTGTAYSNSGYSRGVEGSNYTRGLGTYTEVSGMSFGVGHYGPGARSPLATIATANAISNTIYNNTNSTITTAYGNRVNFSAIGTGGTWGTVYGNHVTFPTAGTIGTMYGYYIPSSSVNTTNRKTAFYSGALSGTGTANYGMYLSAVSGATSNYSIYSAGGVMYHAGNVGIGTISPTNLLSLGGNSARIFWMERHTTANTAGNTLTITAGGATSGATDKNGGNLLLQGGLSTGTGESGVAIYGCVAGASGTTDRTQTIAIQTLGNKLGFYAVTPIVRPTTSISASAFVQNSGNTVNDASTFGGYTLQQVVQALQNIGVLT